MTTEKGYVIQAFKDMVFDLQSRTLQRSREEIMRRDQLVSDSFVVLPTRSNNWRGQVKPQVFAFYARFSAQKQQLFGVIFDSVMRSFDPSQMGGWDSSFWEIQDGPNRIEISTDEMLFAIALLRINEMGTIWEQELNSVLEMLYDTPLTNLFGDKQVNAPGPDAYFGAGGRSFGLPFEAFFVEAKAGDAALANVIDGISSALKKYPGATPRERYGVYCRAFAERAGARAPERFGIALVALLYVTDRRAPRIPPRVGDYYDQVIVVNAFGQRMGGQ